MKRVRENRSGPVSKGTVIKVDEQDDELSGVAGWPDGDPRAAEERARDRAMHAAPSMAIGGPVKAVIRPGVKR